jgi:hypothetical protein
MIIHDNGVLMGFNGDFNAVLYALIEIFMG